MIEIKKKTNCCGCRGCEQSCPVNAISMENDDEGFWYPKVNQQRCINCGQCKIVCPELNPSGISGNSDVYAAYRKDLNLRLKSQSGGIFSVIAEKVLSEGGVVFGAAFDVHWRVRHRSIENIEEIDMLRGSKYVQSDIGNTYKEAEDLLKKGRTVFFSGTPCQIQGLKKYLRKDYDNLITVDLICHGVPSPEVWDTFLKEYIGKENIKEFIQKDKNRKNAIVYKLKNGQEQVESYEQNVYSKGFCKDLYLRPSCHQCHFKGIERCSDITIGDFWGIERFLPGFGDQYGVSAIIVHTDKGRKMYHQIQNELVMQQCEPNWVGVENPCLLQSLPENEKRIQFFEQWREKGVINTVNELTQISISEKIKLEMKKKYLYALELGSAVKKRISKMR